MQSLPDFIRKCTDTSALFHEAKTAIVARIVSKLFAFMALEDSLLCPQKHKTNPVHTPQTLSLRQDVILSSNVPISLTLYLVLSLQTSRQKFCMNIPSPCSTLKTRVTSVTPALLILVT